MLPLAAFAALAGLAFALHRAGQRRHHDRLSALYAHMLQSGGV